MRMTFTESVNSGESMISTSNGALIKRKRAIKIDILSETQTNLRCVSGLRERNGNNVRVNMPSSWFPILKNLLPPSYIPLAAPPPKKPRRTMEKLLYKLGAKLLINTSVDPFIVCFMLSQCGFLSLIPHLPSM